jgi:V8-like Glu-specific endopeptidase
MRYFNAHIVEDDPIHDICLLKCDIINLYNPIVISSTDNVNVSDKICIIGYPHCIHGRHVLTYQETIIGAKILINNGTIKTKHIVLNIQTRPGQSGSPVFRYEDSSLIAVIIGSYAPNKMSTISLGGIDPFTLHQTTHAISSEYISKML